MRHHELIGGRKEKKKNQKKKKIAEESRTIVKFLHYLSQLTIIIPHWTGIVRETEQRGDQRRKLVRERFAEEHDATRSGESIQPVRQNHHVADTLRQHHR